MPFHFGVLNFHTINNKDLIEHIERMGIDLLFDSRFDD